MSCPVGGPQSSLLSSCGTVISAGLALPSPSLWARLCAVCQKTGFPHEGLCWPGRDMSEAWVSLNVGPGPAGLWQEDVGDKSGEGRRGAREQGEGRGWHPDN